MAQRKQQPKFERNPSIRLRNNCDTDDGQMTDKFRFHELCQHGQAELKLSGQLSEPKFGPLG